MSLFFWNGRLSAIFRILAIIPIAGLFVLFDIIVHNPRDQDTSSNLALLDMTAGHFSSLEYRSKGVLPGSLISEFAHIARMYVNNVKQHDASGHTQILPSGTTFFSNGTVHGEATNVLQNSGSNFAKAVPDLVVSNQYATLILFLHLHLLTWRSSCQVRLKILIVFWASILEAFRVAERTF